MLAALFSYTGFPDSMTEAQLTDVTGNQGLNQGTRPRNGNMDYNL